ncbi:recombination mediator RecR [Sediminicurvatus halobius]|uniref:Recombination protein RecR n=1 Tax=Sediminicurvatus halobius TaxID=2182432 RepID=A0A2U2N3B1_9GAMM|nr:recombination mediator RecR [Spiribacter halobius]PWG63711.1 recombination protein RecR [Spiribacter halobius]UEX79849.1 recombination mediator RecR [Spiribacter halobius]
MAFSPLVRELMEALRCLPGVGPKSAQRMTFQLLQRDRGGARRLAEALAAAADGVGECRECRTLTEEPVCAICASPRRERSLLCIVENPADVSAVEEATDYGGLYFVLKGRLSPLDGIGPAELGLDALESRFAGGEVREIILATNPTVEGEATAQYVAEMARARGIVVSRIAHGVPVGGDLEYVDSGTLSHAFAGRREYR